MSFGAKYAGDAYSWGELVSTLFGWLALLTAFTYFLGWWSLGSGVRYCGAETVGLHRDDSVFVNNNQYFGGVAARTDRLAFAGQHSIRLDTAHPYGFLTRLHDLRPTLRFRATVWRTAENPAHLSNGRLVAAMRNDAYYRTGARVIAERDGWQQIELRIDSLPPLWFRSLDIYCWNTQAPPVYFDELRIERLD